MTIHKLLPVQWQTFRLSMPVTKWPTWVRKGQTGYEMIIMKITLWVQNGQNGMTDVREPGSGTRETTNSYLTEVVLQCFRTGCFWKREFVSDRGCAAVFSYWLFMKPRIFSDRGYTAVFSYWLFKDFTSAI